MSISSKSDDATQVKALERENALLRRLASGLKHTIDAMRRGESDKARSNLKNEKSRCARRDYR
jgi:hypothetical protein